MGFGVPDCCFFVILLLISFLVLSGSPWASSGSRVWPRGDLNENDFVHETELLDYKMWPKLSKIFR